MIARLLMAAALTCAAAGCATSEDMATRGGNLGRITSERLERFESEAAFRQYLRDAQYETRRQGGWWAGRVYPRTRAPRPFSEQTDDEAIVVTGTRLVRQDFEAMSPITSIGAEQLELTATLTTDSLINELPQSITNNQERGVDEGDNVKRIGRFLVVLQDGRLFTVDLLPDGAPGLRFVDRENVYRSMYRSNWIDEMLVFGRRIVVTGYSYHLHATEVSIFVMSDDGELAREAIYYISSNDYYDPENYATRIVGDNLVFYTPLGLRSIDPDMPFRWPVVRRWLRDDEREAVLSEGEPLFDARDIYRPIQQTTAPTVYTISVCPLGASARGAELNCRSTAFVAPDDRVVYMSPEHIYVWASDNAWEARRNARDLCAVEEEEDVTAPPRQRATLYQVSLNGDLRALRTQGAPPNQFAMAASDGELRALLQDICDETRLTYFHAPLGAFRRDRPAFADARRYTDTPRMEGHAAEVRVHRRLSRLWRALELGNVASGGDRWAANWARCCGANAQSAAPGFSAHAT
ncbi:MAG: beta-propeller domain-containing protein [Alphaproteobacteria bacterium]|nr:beta-propeller domain-containing protein [Alphaproteobacteria bacterium]